MTFEPRHHSNDRRRLSPADGAIILGGDKQSTRAELGLSGSFESVARGAPDAAGGGVKPTDRPLDQE